MSQSTPNTPLLSALYRLRMSAPDSLRAGDEIETLLKEGADPNQANSSGITPLSFFYTDPPAIQVASETRFKLWQYKEALSSIVAAGGDTMAQSKLFYSKADDQYKLTAIQSLTGKAADTNEVFLACFESMDLPWSNNAAIVIADKYPKWISDTRPSDGKNVLHLIWDSILPRGSALVQDHADPLLVEQAWDKTYLFSTMGASLHAPDDSGATPAHLICSMLENGLPLSNPTTGQDLFEEMLALIQTRSLQASTPGAPHVSRAKRF